MTYLAEKPANTVAPVKEKQLITVEFAPEIHSSETEYSYEHPRFVFGDRVVLKNEYPEISYTVCALELVESKTPSGKLLSQPRWKYKVSNGEVNYWKEESALTRYTQKTCLTCDRFNDYNEPNGRGWCQLFDDYVKTNHKRTDNCILNGAVDRKNEAFPPEELESELDKPHSEYSVGSIVKVIDEHEHHTEWGIFEIVECRYNYGLHRSSESYLNEVAWYYRLASNNNSTGLDKTLWVAEDEICPFDMAHLICTEEVF